MQEPDMFRIVICCDVEAKTAVSAYRKLFAAMRDVEDQTEASIQWESTEEWYTPDGDTIPEETILGARLIVIGEDLGNF